MPFISSNPDAWMRPYYEAVAAREGFAQLAIPIQFAALVDAIAVDYPANAIAAALPARSCQPRLTPAPRRSARGPCHQWEARVRP